MDFVFDYGFGDSAFQIIFYLIFAAVIGCFIVTAVRGIRTWHKNNNSPRLTVHATVVSKRQNTSVHHHHNDNTAMHTSTSTSYYATFQFDSGDRLELHVSGPDHGLLAEGDTGDLTFQGTRYLASTAAPPALRRRTKCPRTRPIVPPKRRAGTRSYKKKRSRAPPYGRALPCPTQKAPRLCRRAFNCVVQTRSDSASDLAGTQASGTNVHMARRAVDHSLDALDIGLPGTIGTPVRMGHLDTKGHALVAKFALCHPLHLLAVVT